MRTITETLYKFNELSEEAQQTAIDELRETIGNWAVEDAYRDYDGAFEKFKEITGITIDWGDSYGGFCKFYANYNPDYSHIVLCSELIAYTCYGFHPDIELRTLKGKLLQRWIRNNIEVEFIRPKTYYLWEKRVYNEKTHEYNYPKRKSKVNYWKRDEASPSGLWIDTDLYEPFLYYLAHPDETTTFEDLLDEALREVAHNLEIEYDSYFEDKYIRMILSECYGDWEFYEDGECVERASNIA